MKKVLFATTALVLSAGFASAEVSLSGDGRMGVVYDGNDWNFSSRARVVFTLSGQTDGGLEFGGSFKTSDIRSATDPRLGNAGSVYVSGAFGKIEMGDVTSAPEALMGDLAEVGYMGDDQGSQNGGTNDIPYLTLDNNTQSALLYTYSAGAFSVAVAMSDAHQSDAGFGWTDPDSDPSTAPVWGAIAADESQAYSVAGAYTFGNYTVALGYEVLDYGVTGVSNTTQLELAGIATFGNTSVKAYYADQEDGLVDTAYGLSVASVFGATTVSGYVQKAEAVSGTDVTWYGIGAAYDLGGGASLAGAIQDDDVSGSDPTANLGVKFKF